MRTRPPEAISANVPTFVVALTSMILIAVAVWTNARLPVPPADASIALSTGSAIPTDRVVRVRAVGCNGVTTGSGVIIGGVVVTNRHVVANASRVEATMTNGTNFEIAVVRQSSSNDVAVLDAKGLPTGLRLAHESASSAALGADDLLVAGFPGGDGLLQRSTRIVRSEIGGGIEDPRVALRLDVTVQPGESGSPVVDQHGEVVGLVYARARDNGQGLVLPVRNVLDGMNDASAVAFGPC